MTEAERQRIISQEYADFIIDYNHNYSIFEDVEDSTLNPINSNIAIIHTPVDNMSFNSISKYGYYSIPSCYGLLSNEVLGLNSLWNFDAMHTYENESKTSGGMTGAGVLIGFIDTGIDYTHLAFLDAENKTRIARIWDQTIQSENPIHSANNYGTVYTREQINTALMAENPFEVVPSVDNIGHGTMLAGFATGTLNQANKIVGIAPGAELVIVKLKQAKPYLLDFFEISQNAICYQENDIMMGVKYLDDIARELKKPLIICLGLGNSLSDHAGGRTISRYLAYISSQRVRSVIVAGGNEGNRDNHFYSNYLAPSTFEDVYLKVGEGEEGFSMQFWGLSPNYFWIDLFAPGDVFLARVPPINTETTVVEYEDSTVIIDILLNIPYFYEQSIIFRFHNPKAGEWKFHVFGASGEISMEFHFWLPLHNFLSEKTAFLESDPFTTLTGPSNNTNLITTVAYNPTTVSLEYNSGKGFTVNNSAKPDVTAPGVNVVCPFPGNQYILGAGSSLSAAFTAGVAARIFEWAIVKGNFPDMNHAVMKKVMVQSAYRIPDLTYPNRDWSYGILSIDRIPVVLDELLNLKTIP